MIQEINKNEITIKYYSFRRNVISNENTMLYTFCRICLKCKNACVQYMHQLKICFCWLKTSIEHAIYTKFRFWQILQKYIDMKQRFIVLNWNIGRDVAIWFFAVIIRPALFYGGNDGTTLFVCTISKEKYNK